MSKKKAILIGTGAIAREHLLVLQRMPDVEVEAVCDLSPARAESTADRFKVGKWFTDLETMLGNTSADLIHITTPPQSHFPIAKRSLEAGLNVLCEKPITPDYKQFVTLKKLAESKGLHLFENHNYKHHSSILAIKKAIDNGELGEVVEVQVLIQLGIHGPGSVFVDNNVAHYSATLKGGVVGDFVTHISYLIQMFAGPNFSVSNFGLNYSGSASHREDEYRALLKGEKATAYVSFSGNSQPNGFYVRVNGTRAQIESNLFEPPRVSIRRLRGGAPPIATMKDGISEGLQIFKGSIAAFWRKLAGTGRYDGLGPYISSIYAFLDNRGASPLTLQQLDDCCRLVETLSKTESV